jgi:pyruvate dehydrogenase complex dehydrogenase (E1) component
LLRSFFEVDRYQIVIAALDALARDETIDRKLVADAIERLRRPVLPQRGQVSKPD